MKCSLIAAIAASLACAIPAFAGGGPIVPPADRYTVTELLSGNPVAVNTRGDVAYDSFGSVEVQSGVSIARVTQITEPNAQTTYAGFLNDSGAVVGLYDGSVFGSYFNSPDADIPSVDGQNGYVTGLANDGTMLVNEYSRGTSKSLLIKDGVRKPIRTPRNVSLYNLSPNGLWAAGNDGKGCVVETALNRNLTVSVSHGVTGYAVGVKNDGSVFGMSYLPDGTGHAVLWTNGKAKDLTPGLIAGYASLRGINAAGTAIIDMYIMGPDYNGQYVPSVLLEGKTQLLNDLVHADGLVIQQFSGINEAGRIICSGTYYGYSVGVILDPVAK